MSCLDCNFVMVDGVWLPNVAGVQLTPNYVSDIERAVSGVLRVAHTAVAREWRVTLNAIPGADAPAVTALLMRTPEPRPVRVMGADVLASVTVAAVAHVPVVRRGELDVNRVTIEVSIVEALEESVLPGYSLRYEMFAAVGSFTWDWEAAGKPDTVDVLLVGGGAGGGQLGTNFGTGGGGAGGVLLTTSVAATGSVNGTVGAGGAPATNGSSTTFGGLTAVGGGAGGLSTGPSVVDGSAGGSGGGGGAYNGVDGAGGAGTSGQGRAGGNGSGGTFGSGSQAQYGGGGGGGGAAGGGAAGGGAAGGVGGAGGAGVDLLSLGWNYRSTPGAPRFVGGGGGGDGGRNGTIGRHTPGVGGVGGGGAGQGNTAAPGDGQPLTGGGGGGGGGGGSGGSGLVIIRYRATQ